MLRTGRLLAPVVVTLALLGRVDAGETGHAHASGPTDVLLRAALEGQPISDYALLYGNGRLLVREPGARPNAWYGIWLTEPGIQRVLGEAIEGASLFRQPNRAVNPACDGPAPSVTLAVESRTVTVSAAGLECIVEPSDLDRRLLRFFGYLDRLTQALFQPNEVIAWGPFVSDALHVTSLATGTTGGANWPPGVLDPFDGGRLFCYAAASYLRDTIDGARGSFNRANVNYEVSYEELLPASEGWKLCHGSDTPPAAMDLVPAPEPIEHDVAPTSVVLRQSYDQNEAFSVYPPFTMTGEVLRAYGDGTMLVSGSVTRRGGGAGDEFWRWRLSEPGLTRILRDFVENGAIALQPAEYPSPCADCAPPIIEVDAGGLRRRIVTGFDPIGESGLQKTLSEAIARLDSFTRYLMPGEIQDWEPYFPGPVWVQAFDIGLAGHSSEWPAGLPSAASLATPALLCGAEADRAVATLRGRGQRWGYVDDAPRTIAVRFRPAFPEELAGCGKDGDDFVRHPTGRRDLILRFAERGGSLRAGPVRDIPYDRVVLFGDGTLVTLGGGDRIGFLPAARQVQLTEAGIQRVLRAVVIDGAALEKPGPEPSRSSVTRDAPIPIVEVHVTRGSNRAEFTWRSTDPDDPGLPGRAVRMLEFLRGLDSLTFAPGEVIREEAVEYWPAVWVQAIPYIRDTPASADEWPRSLPDPAALRDGMALCGEFVDLVFQHVADPTHPVVRVGDDSWWLDVRFAWPNEYNDATCPRTSP